VASALASSGAVKVSLVEAPRRWRIEADSRIGIVVGDGWELRIRPHLKVPRLLFLLAYSENPDGWREAVTGMAEEDDVVDAIASGFSFHAERAVEQGLLRGYLPIEERRNDLRGRIRIGAQLARLPGMTLPLEVAYDDFTADIPENRLLRTAAERLLVLPRIPAQARSRLVGLRAVLDEVTVLRNGRRVDRPPPTRLNQRYGPALILGKLILDGTSLRQERGKIAATNFLFDMNEVFESFVFAALRESLRRFGGVVQRQAPGALDTAEKPGLRLRADIVWRKHGAVRAVVDSKYKSLFAGSTMPNADAYQMLAYCIGFGVRRGFLVYARDSLERPRVHVIKRHGYEIDVQAVDVQQEPRNVLTDIDRVADKVASTVIERAGATAAMAV
jgi:5-methylcytosine-specific restriction enzyme subunit McrC